MGFSLGTQDMERLVSENNEASTITASICRHMSARVSRITSIDNYLDTTDGFRNQHSQS